MSEKCHNKFILPARHNYSMAVEGLDLEKNGIEANLVPKGTEFFVEQHIQN